MADFPVRYNAKLDDYYLDIIDITDNFDVALSVHEYPFSNRNIIENMGQKTRVLNVNCVFQQNPPAELGRSASSVPHISSYDKHFFFLEYIRSGRKSYTFTHPKYGELNGQIANVRVDHDDTPEYCKISFEFLEQLETEKVTTTIFIVNEEADQFRIQNTNVLNALNESRRAAVSLTQWTARMVQGQAYLDAYLNAITSPATSIINTIHYASDTASQTMQSINSAVDRVVQSFVDTRNLPAQFLNNIAVGFIALRETFADGSDEANYVQVMSASRLGYEAAIIYEEDETDRDVVKSKERVSSFDLKGNYIATTTIVEAMTSNELEISLADVRTILNEAVAIERRNGNTAQVETLLTQAKLLQGYINTIKLDREKIETKEYPIQTLHSIARDNNLSYQAASRLLSMNPDIHNPSFVSGGVEIPVPPEEVSVPPGFLLGSRWSKG